MTLVFPDPAPKQAPEALALRARPRPVTRLSRRALIGLGATSALALAAAAIWALGVHRGGPLAPQELYSTDRKSVAEGLNQLPRDYGSLPRSAPAPVPQLGPPLPGDLGRPFLRAEREQGVPLPAAPVPEPARPSPEEEAARLEAERLRREAEQAAKAQVFFATRQRPADQAGTEEGAAEAARRDPFGPLAGTRDAASARAAVDEAAAQNGQERKAGFLAAAVDPKIYSPQRLQSPVSPHQVMAGTVIAAAMVTGLTSDLPGQVIASVTEPVYDTVTGRTLLIPQGSRLLGTYDAGVSYGQSRILLAWTRLIMPDGTSIVLDRLPGTDSAGRAGLSDEVDNHWGKLLAGAALSTVLGIGAELARPDRGLGDGQQTIVVAGQRSAQDSVNGVGQQITRRNLNVQPTLTVRPGFPVRVIVNKDIVLRPYGARRTAASRGGGR